MDVKPERYKSRKMEVMEICYYKEMLKIKWNKLKSSKQNCRKENFMEEKSLDDSAHVKGLLRNVLKDRKNKIREESN